MEGTEPSVQDPLARMLHLAAQTQLSHLCLAGSVPQFQPEKGQRPQRHLLWPCWADCTDTQPWHLQRKRALPCKSRRAASPAEENRPSSCSLSNLTRKLEASMQRVNTQGHTGTHQVRYLSCQQRASWCWRTQELPSWNPILILLLSEFT